MICDDEDLACDTEVDEDIQVGDTGDANERDNHKVMKEASGKNKNPLRLQF